MEQDVVSRASDFLSSDQFSDRLNDDDRHALEHWMTSRIEAERKGFRNTLQRSLQEVERERKLTLEVHAAIQGVNERLEARMGDLMLSREPSMYHGSDLDSRVYTTTLLEKNIDAVLRCVGLLLEDREKCLASLHDLDVGDDMSSSGTTVMNGLHLALSDKLQKLNFQQESSTKCHQAEVASLRRHLEELSAQLEQSEIKKQEEKHLKEIDALTEIIARQRVQIEELVNRNINRIAVATQTNAVDLKEIGVQVEGVENIDSDRSESESVVDSKIRFPPPIQSITITRPVEKNNGKREWKTHTLELERMYSSNLSTPIRRSDNFQETKSSHSRGRSSARSLETSDFERRQTIDTLRGQVIEFAERLERAKDEVERYQRQLAWINKTPHNQLLNNELIHMRKSSMNGEAMTKYQDGFLSGARKDILPAVSKSQDTLVLKSHLRRARHAHPVGASNSTSRCLRCHKLYKLRDNHRKACRYHSRGKKKIEKYDDNGKLVTVTYLWECCMQASDAQGCSAGEHI